MNTGAIMKRIAASFALAACLFPLTASAMWVRLTDVDLVEQSDVIVLATLARTEQQPMPGSRALEIGVLDIHEVLKGPASLREVGLAQPAANSPRSSADIRYKIGQKGLWFLRPYPHAADPALYGADHPQRFMPEEAAVSRLTYFRDLIKASRK
jgi:hypothetical protein